MIQIKRLKLAGSEFVPITLAEAVVVNVKDIAGFTEEITTLDKVLALYCGLTAYSITAIDNINNELKNNYLKKLIAGLGIDISDDGVISATFGGNDGISYKISMDGLPEASKECLNIIYLVPYPNGDNDNIFEEFICYEQDGLYLWEKIGSITSDISFDNLVTRLEFESFQAASITSVSVYNSQGKEVEFDLDLTTIGSLYDIY